MAPKPTRLPLADLEDRLVKTRALLNFSIFTVEACDVDDFKMMKNEFNTMFHLLKDQLRGMEDDLHKITDQKPFSLLMREQKV